MRSAQIVVERTNLWADAELKLDCFFVFVAAIAAEIGDSVVSVAAVNCSMQPRYLSYKTNTI